MATALLAFAATYVTAGPFLRDEIFPHIREGGVTSIVLFVIAYAAGTAMLWPMSVFNVVAGSVWGWWAGGVLTASGATLGSLVTFTIARAYARRFHDPIGSAVLEKFGMSETDRFRGPIIFLLRLNFVLPTGPLNLALARMSIGTIEFTVWTFLGLLPASGLVAYLGELSIQGLLAENGIALAVFFILLLALKYALSRSGRRSGV